MHTHEWPPPFSVSICTLNKTCVQAMSERDTIGGLLRAAKCCIGEELGLIGETLFCIFDTPGSDALIAQNSLVS
ncbi:unnamed protein product [Protopolystoma xenopodis]|uniref:Uncharacterized protein n=1 Tax=Protopolystoma xenopodis TaxID=117903 RepID=A0A3S5A151_9PLAT|nr:unnamed protein product [Protopolystoma xenopodis]